MIAIGSIVKTTQASPESAANKAITNHQFAGLIDEVEIFNAVLGPGSISLLAGGRYGIGTPNDSAVSAPAPPPLPVVATPPLAVRATPLQPRPPAPPPPWSPASPATPTPLNIRPTATPLAGARPSATPAPTAATPARVDTAALKMAATPAVGAAPKPAPAQGAVTKVDKTNPAVVKVTDLTGEPLAKSPDKASGLWEAVGDEWKGATVFIKAPKRPAFAELTVTKAGRVYIACDYGYQGNAGGGWKSEVWKEEDFLKDGWTLVLSELRMWERKDMTIFTKVLPAGTTLHLRCNKYWPPNVITF